MLKKRALLSVSDKTGVIDFARGLLEFGYEIISTGGTASALAQAGIPRIEVSELTGFPECLDGRVKTLHPAVHAGLLARRENPEHLAQLERLGIATIDTLAVNLYPFKQTIMRPGVTFEDAIENIDIGGPTMLRAAAKNWQDVAVLCDPADYSAILEQLAEGEVSRELKARLALKVFEHTGAYDALISGYLRGQLPGANLFPAQLTLTYEKAQDMRYGENPHQQGAFYREAGATWEGVLGTAEQLHGKELSYNNINDAAGALDLLKELGGDSPCVVAVKHANPCGVGLGDSLLEAYIRAHDADPVSIFGGIVAVNHEVDEQTAQEMCKIFLEVIIAPGYAPEALEVFASKKNIRLLKLSDILAPNSSAMLDAKKVAGGLLVQQLDAFGAENELKTVTERAPTPQEMEQLRFAWKVAKHVKSNGIVLVKDGCTVGVGPGQTNRVTALELAAKYAGARAQGSVLASDAFFPFDDCVELARKIGVTAIIQPGGSLRDEDSITACNAAGIAMIFTGRRHFKH
ncbi:MAG: bifunctional phosphoribosylaminoimidazolecarboxamide formyltransferase/IMP cyclohydrolase [Oscillospiraceae bacterium]|nr:bifunctional phosphoribosylaminoimidazolecarboxamide formyltransferase/IMP cyclohydrolase [Oscillospiraceae bacterium]